MSLHRSRRRARGAFSAGLLDLPVVIPRPVGHDGPGTKGIVAPAFRLGPRHRRPAEYGPLLEQELLQRERQAVKEVPAVRDLRRVGGALGQGLAVDVRAVAGSELYLRVPTSTRPRASPGSVRAKGPRPCGVRGPPAPSRRRGPS